MVTRHQYTVEGISCINCVNGIKSHLLKKKVSKVSVDIAKGLVTILNNEYSNEELKSFLSDLGYNPKEYKLNSNTSLKLEYYLIISTILSLPLLGHMFVSEESILQNPWLQLGLSTPVMILGYLYFFKGAYKSLLNLKPNMNVLILMGSTSAYIYSLIGWFLNINSAHHFLFFETAATIITLVLLGNYFEKRSIAQTTTALDSLQKLQIKNAVKDVDGTLVECLITDLDIGDIVIVNQGNAIPIDGIIVWGKASIDESMISGESVPVFKEIDGKTIGGTIVLEGNIKISVNSKLEDTVLSHIIEMVGSAQEDKPEIQELGDRISAIFVPVVLAIAIATFALNYLVFDQDFQNAILRSIAVLVISCPCAMGLATPTAVMVGVGRAAKNGILIKGGATIELFSKTKKVVFDKTGTLTNGEFKIQEFKKWDDSYPIEAIIYELEKHSSHPIAKSLCKNLESYKTKIEFTELNEIKGKGFTAIDKLGNTYTFGSAKFLSIEEEDLKTNYQLFLNINNKLVAALSIQDQIMEGAKELVEFLNAKNIETILLSGDTKQKCDSLAKEIGIKTVFAEQSPEEKIKKIKVFTAEENTSMFGDGINDAPALTKATVGISYSKATEVAVKSASIVLLNHKLSLLEKTYQICTHTYKTIKQNLFWAFAYNLIAIPLAAMGYLSPIFAALTMAFSDIVVIGNSIRLKYKNINS